MIPVRVWSLCDAGGKVSAYFNAKTQDVLHHAGIAHFAFDLNLRPIHRREEAEL